MADRALLNLAAKSERRTWILDQLLEVMKSDEIFKTLDYRNKSEAYIKQYMHQLLKRRLVKVHNRLSPGVSAARQKRKADESLMWEGDVKTTINHVRLLGVQHRPDFKVLVDGLRIAVEVKRGESGSAIREGVGQSVVYAVSEDFDFVIHLFIDTSKDKKILESLKKDRENAFVASLWDHYCVRFSVV